jgi:hypothetical protein
MCFFWTSSRGITTPKNCPPQFENGSLACSRIASGVDARLGSRRIRLRDFRIVLRIAAVTGEPVKNAS